MGRIVSEGLENVGEINANGQVFDTSGNHIATIDDNGYINKPGGWGQLGKIDEDGTIRDSSSNVIGRIQADGYTFIHSKRVAKVSSSFVQRITPLAWDAGKPSTYKGRKKAYNDENMDTDNGTSHAGFYIKLILGLGLGIYAWIDGWGGPEMLIAGPCVVFLLVLIAKICNNLY